MSKKVTNENIGQGIRRIPSVFLRNTNLDSHILTGRFYWFVSWIVGLGRGLQSLKDSEDDVDLLIARKNLKFEIRKIMKGNKIIIVETFYLACERCNIPWKIDSHHMRVQAKSKIQSSDSKDDWTWYIPPKDYRRVCNKKKTISIVNICLFLKTCRHNTGCGRETYFFERLIKTKLLQISV